MKKIKWSLILTGINAVGVVVTAILSAKAGMEFEKFRDGDIREKAEVAGPAVVAGAVTIAAGIAAHGIDAKTIAGLSATVAMGANRLKALNAAIDEKYSKEEAADIRMKAAEKSLEENCKEVVGDPERLFCFRYGNENIYFRSTTPKVMQACMQVNREIFDFSVGCGIATVSDLLTWVDHPELKTKKTDKAGWCLDILNIDCDCYYLEFFISPAKKLYHGEQVNVIEAVWDPLKDFQKTYDEYIKEGLL